MTARREPKVRKASKARPGRKESQVILAARRGRKARQEMRERQARLEK